MPWCCAAITRFNAIKAAKLPGVASPLEMADAATVRKVTGCEPGFAGPMGLDIKTYYDHATANMADFVIGANEVDMHYTGVNFGRDLERGETVDLRNILEGDPVPRRQRHDQACPLASRLATFSNLARSTAKPWALLCRAKTARMS